MVIVVATWYCAMAPVTDKIAAKIKRADIFPSQQRAQKALQWCKQENRFELTLLGSKKIGFVPRRAVPSENRTPSGPIEIDIRAEVLGLTGFNLLQIRASVRRLNRTAGYN